MSTVKATKLTYETYMALPETKERCEVVDGEIYVPPGPSLDHQLILVTLAAILRGYVERNGLGIVLTAPCDLIIQRDPLRVRQPDVMFLSAERTGFRSRSDVRGLANVEVAPDLVVEIGSPSNTPRIMEDRLRDYRQLGVLECWLVDPETETVRVLDLTDAAGPEASFDRNETLESKTPSRFHPAAGRGLRLGLLT